MLGEALDPDRRRVLLAAVPERLQGAPEPSVKEIRPPVCARRQPAQAPGRALRVLDASQRKRLAERYAAGETMAELAREYGCGVASGRRVSWPGWSLGVSTSVSLC
jgi:hypothetical protein